MVKFVVSALALVGLVSALPAGATGPQYQPPSGCQLDMTVQMHNCQVANHFRCGGDPDGDRRVSFADGQGEFYLSHIDRETRWLDSVSLDDGIMDTLDDAGSKQHASFSTLIATGRDDFDFVTHDSTGQTRRYIGFDQLTGETVTFGAVTLERTTFSLRIEDGDGNLVATRFGNQFINRDMRLFFSDTERFETPDGQSGSTFEAPVTFALPGDKGFGAAQPKYDCDMMMTRLSQPEPKPTL